jgi:hypothetical protein
LSVNGGHGYRILESSFDVSWSQAFVVVPTKRKRSHSVVGAGDGKPGPLAPYLFYFRSLREKPYPSERKGTEYFPVVQK